ncbi:cysteine hydrolase family protein [Steroidobacter flavus]|uniref:Cysteine hydrolase family protein n=1 Tax=Steroidobacter flavus TaxID=1842136 RepID=A0ABV8SZZ2_9GAMM
MLNLSCERGRTIALNPETTALVCIDFQRDFVSRDGMAAARGATVDRLLSATAAARVTLDVARQLGMFVCHTREIYAPDLSDLNRFRRKFDSIVGEAGPLGRFLIRGEPGSEIVDEMRPRADEPVIDKAGFSAFHQTSLENILSERRIETLLLTGVTTQCCVASTLRSAVDLGYCCVLLEDACAAYDPADHEATLRVIYSEGHTFGWVSDTTRFRDSRTG